MFRTNSIVKRTLFEILIAVVFVEAVTVFTHLFANYGASQASLLISVLAVVLSTWYGGFNSGMIAVILAIFVNVYYFLLPAKTLEVQAPEDIWRLLIFTIVATVISFLTSERKKAEEAERSRTEWFRVTIASIGDGVIVTDPLGKVKTMNAVAEQLTGWKEEEAESKSIDEVFQIVHEVTRERVENPVAKVIQEGKISGLATHSLLIPRNGNEIPIDDSGSPIKGNSGEIIGIVLVFRDTTEKRKAESELERSAERLRLAMEGGNLGVWDWTVKTGQLNWIGNLERLHGLLPGEGPKDYQAFRRLIYKDDVELFEKTIQNSLKNGTPFSVEFRVMWEDESLHWIGGGGRPYYEDGEAVRMVGISTDLTERKLTEETIASQLIQKEILLKEVHHRVKNNLQIISSLLSLQTSKADKGSRDALIESRSRIQSMALIHEKLYQSQDLSRIDLGQYIRDLATILYNTYGAETERIQFNLISNGVLADIDTAIPCGLIANEIISNSLKHAFPEQAKGSIDFTLFQENGLIRIEVGDNGAGFSTAIKLEQSSSLGLKLIWSLVAQLKGSIKVQPLEGTHFSIQIPFNDANKSQGT